MLMDGSVVEVGVGEVEFFGEEGTEGGVEFEDEDFGGWVLVEVVGDGTSTCADFDDEWVVVEVCGHCCRQGGRGRDEGADGTGVFEKIR